jgi:hypothetical protein
MKILFKRKMESGGMSLEGNIEKDVETERKVHEGYTSEDESNPSLDKYFSARSSAFVLHKEFHYDIAHVFYFSPTFIIPAFIARFRIVSETV